MVMFMLCLWCCGGLVGPRAPGPGPGPWAPGPGPLAGEHVACLPPQAPMKRPAGAALRRPAAAEEDEGHACRALQLL